MRRSKKEKLKEIGAVHKKRSNENLLFLILKVFYFQKSFMKGLLGNSNKMEIFIYVLYSRIISIVVWR